MFVAKCKSQPPLSYGISLAEWLTLEQVFIATLDIGDFEVTEVSRLIRLSLFITCVACLSKVVNISSF